MCALVSITLNIPIWQLMKCCVSLRLMLASELMPSITFGNESYTLTQRCSPGPDEPAAADEPPPAVDGDWSLELVLSPPLGPAPPASRGVWQRI